MSEQKFSYMQQLDAWTQTTIIDPLADVADEQLYDELTVQIKKAIREKVLESYRNGQKASPTRLPARKEPGK